MVARGVDRALLDVRNVMSASLTTTEIFSLATTFREAGFRHGHRLAVLHRPTRDAGAEFFALCAAQRGWNVCAFDSFEDAFDWLAAEPRGPPMASGGPHD